MLHLTFWMDIYMSLYIIQLIRSEKEVNLMKLDLAYNRAEFLASKSRHTRNSLFGRS
jgi:hypothetical protein